ncbi:MAG: ABC transporter ATP-binding protein [Candidatus Omnitrophica bacterium]|nr:ABC transporter ATP-binding protein [Candidatus Omnitrophota bacterium]
MIRVSKLNHFYGKQRALADVDLAIGKGEIVGFLGCNGAGKTTLMRILTTFLRPASGEVFVAQMDALRRPLDVRRKIGYLPENPPLYPALTVGQYLYFAARLKDVPARKQKMQVDKVIAACSLRAVRDRLIAALSKGFKQRVGLAQAVINEPPVLILDEPTNGLDPVQILQVRDLIKQQGSERTVLLSTHILSEIEQVAPRVLIIQKGEIIADGKQSDLLARAGKKNLEELFLAAVRGEE